MKTSDKLRTSIIIATILLMVFLCLITITTPVYAKDNQTTATPIYPITYIDDTMSIVIDKEWYNDETWVYTAQIRAKDYTRIGIYHADNEEIDGVQTEKLQKDFLLCINGNETVFRQEVFDTQSWTIEDLYKDTSALVRNGHITIPIDEFRSTKAFIGTDGHTGHLWLCIAEENNPDCKNAGLTNYECAYFLMKKGCIFGKILPDSDTYTLCFQGNPLNTNPNTETMLTSFFFVK